MATLRELRRARFLEQRELAETVGVSGATISNWETGRKHPRLPNLRRLAEVLGVAPGDIEFPRRLPPTSEVNRR